MHLIQIKQGQCGFQVSIAMIVEPDPKIQKSKVIESFCSLELSNNLDKSKYLNPDGSTTEIGAKVVQDVLIEGLLGNILSCEKLNYSSKEESMQRIIKELQTRIRHSRDIQISSGRKGTVNPRDN